MTDSNIVPRDPITTLQQLRNGGGAVVLLVIAAELWVAPWLAARVPEGAEWTSIHTVTLATGIVGAVTLALNVVGSLIRNRAGSSARGLGRILPGILLVLYVSSPAGPLACGFHVGVPGGANASLAIGAAQVDSGGCLDIPADAPPTVVAAIAEHNQKLGCTRTTGGTASDNFRHLFSPLTTALGGVGRLLLGVSGVPTPAPSP